MQKVKAQSEMHRKTEIHGLTEHENAEIKEKIQINSNNKAKHRKHRNVTTHAVLSSHNPCFSLFFARFGLPFVFYAPPPRACYNFLKGRLSPMIPPLPRTTALPRCNEMVAGLSTVLAAAKGGMEPYCTETASTSPRPGDAFATPPTPLPLPRLVLWVPAAKAVVNLFWVAHTLSTSHHDRPPPYLRNVK